MKTVGSHLRESRQRAGLSLEELAEQTKIRADYLKALETDNYRSLPAATFVKGFIRNYALAVGLEPDKVLAVFRRDFDFDETGQVVPRGLVKPIAQRQQLWNPRTTLVVSVALIGLLFASYGLYQVRSLLGGPQLTLSQPKAAAVIDQNQVSVRGQTNADAFVQVNYQPVSVNSAGEFKTTLDLAAGEHTIVVVAETRDGKQTKVVRTVQVQPK